MVGQLIGRNRIVGQLIGRNRMVGQLIGRNRIVRDRHRVRRGR